MKLSVGEAARLFGVSVRTLRYYDEIGLLKPSEISPSGYRYYDDDAVESLQQIMFYKALRLPLNEITAVLNNPGYDRRQALERHRALLLRERERLDGLVQLVGKTLNGEDTEMDMKNNLEAAAELERTKEKYASEAKARWGTTDAYKENEKKHARYSAEKEFAIAAEAEDIFKRFAALRGSAVDSEPVQALVRLWQEHITKYHYTCTKEILTGLGEMYTADERFATNIDRFGEGTARLMSDAIKVYSQT